MTTSLSFVDTNVLVYAHDSSQGSRHQIAAELLAGLWRAHTGALSIQVLQEFYVVATRRFNPPMTKREARALVAMYGVWHVVEPDAALILSASLLEERHRLSFWDALIIEAAARSGAVRLLTEDLQAGRRLSGVLVENPFA